MLTVQKLHEDLETWVRLGIGDDIVQMPEQRWEYQHLVRANLTHHGVAVEKEVIPTLVLTDLEHELRKPWFMRPTFWILLTHWVKARIVGK